MRFFVDNSYICYIVAFVSRQKLSINSLNSIQCTFEVLLAEKDKSNITLSTTNVFFFFLLDLFLCSISFSHLFCVCVDIRIIQFHVENSIVQTTIKAVNQKQKKNLGEINKENEIKQRERKKRLINLSLKFVTLWLWHSTSRFKIFLSWSAP